MDVQGKTNEELIKELKELQKEHDTLKDSYERDVNERMKVEKELLIEQQRLTNILEGTNVGTWEWNVQTGETVFNDRWADMIGCTLNEISPVSIETWMKFTHPDDLENCHKILEKHFKGELSYYEIESRMRHKNGSWIWILDRGKVFSWTNDGKPLMMMGTHQDITERKQAEEALLKSRNLFQQISHLSKTGGWNVDLVSGEHDWTEVTREIHEVGPDFVPNMEIAIKFYEEGESREKINKVVTRCIETGEPFDLEVQIITNKGNKRWVRSMGSADFIDGKCVKLYGTIQDITKYKQEEKELQIKNRISNIFIHSKHEDFYKEVLDILREFFVSEYGFFGYINEKGDLVSESMTKDIWDECQIEDKSIIFPRDKWNGLWGNALKEKKTLYQNGNLQFPRGHVQLQNAIAAPLLTNKKLIGQIALGNKESDFNEIDKQSINKLCDYIAPLLYSKLKENKYKKELLLSKEKAEKSEEKYRTLYNNVPLSYQSLDENGCFININPMWLKTLGYDRNEVLGTWFGNYLHPDYVEHFKIIFPAFKKRGYVSDVQFKMRKKDGKFIHISFEGYIGHTPDGKFKQIYCVFKDVTKQKALEYELQEKTSFLSTIMETSPVGIVTVDKAGTITYANNRAEHILGLVKKEITSRTYDAPLWKHTDINGSPFPDEKQPFNIVKKSLKTVFDIQHGITWPDGRVVLLSINATPIKDNNANFNGMIASIENITERKEAEKQLKDSEHNLSIKNEEYESINEELKQANEELIIAKEKAEESERLKSAFLANMSHEIRTPMNGILGFAELLNNPELNDNKQQEYVSIIQKSGTRMLSIINDIIDISKIEAGLMKLDVEETNINEQIEYIYTFFKPEVKAKGMKLMLKTTLSAEEATIKTDREKVYAILTNLVKNAIKYSKEGTIKVGYKKRGENLKFYVKDTGIGIPKEKQQSIFERFIQAGTDDKMAPEGAGLGLSITKAYLEMLGGKIWVESEKGIGSTFYFTLPYITEPIKETANQQIDTSDKIDPARELKILIAEDDETSELLLKEKLATIGKEVLIAKTGADAVESCRNNPDIDLILMDIRMPEIGGYEATRKIREFNKEIVIIAQTAYGLSGDREKAIEAGCNDYISKPISIAELLALIQKYFG